MKSRVLKGWLYIFIIAGLIMIACREKDDLLGNDYRLFKETPVWQLAKAIDSKKLTTARQLASQEKLDLDYQEPKFGSTLLMLTVRNRDFESCEMLLELGANPNIHDKFSGSTALIEASGIENDEGGNTRFIRLLLEFGAKVNEEETGVRMEGNSTRMTPLLAACRDVGPGVSPIEKVKVLVEAGAEVNYKNEFNHFPVGEAAIYQHYDVIIYLLEHGARYNEVLFDRSKFQEGGKKIYLVDLLREHLLPLDSDEYKEKMKIVAFLKQKGINYREVPVPPYIVAKIKKQYPQNWQEYIEQY